MKHRFDVLVTQFHSTLDSSVVRLAKQTFGSQSERRLSFHGCFSFLSRRRDDDIAGQFGDGHFGERFQVREFQVLQLALDRAAVLHGAGPLERQTAAVQFHAFEQLDHVAEVDLVGLSGERVAAGHSAVTAEQPAAGQPLHDVREIRLGHVVPPLRRYRHERQDGESVGDFFAQVGVEKLPGVDGDL